MLLFCSKVNVCLIIHLLKDDLLQVLYVLNRDVFHNLFILTQGFHTFLINPKQEPDGFKIPQIKPIILSPVNCDSFFYLAPPPRKQSMKVF